MSDNGSDHEADDKPDPPQRDETGQFPTKVEQEDILAYLEEHRGAFTAALAEEFGVTGETIRRKCYRLANQGAVRARQQDGGGPIFWQPTRENESE